MDSEDTTVSSQTDGASRLLSQAGSLPEDPQIGLHAEESLVSSSTPVAPPVPARNPLRLRQSTVQLETIKDDGEQAANLLTRDTHRLLNRPVSAPKDPQHHSSQHSQMGDMNDHQASHSTLHQGRSFNSGVFQQHDLARSYDGPQDISGSGSRATASSWATGNARTFTGPSVAHGRLLSKDSIDEYNRLTNHHQLAALSIEALDYVRSGSDGSTESAPKPRPDRSSWFPKWTGLRRLPSSSSMKVKHKSSMLQAKKSVAALSNMVPHRPKDIFKDQPLQVICKLGGLSTLELPKQFAALEYLAVPLSVCATAYYLLEHGRTAPGVFRLSGQQSAVNALYDFYAKEDVSGSFNGHLNNVVTTVGKGKLPGWLEYTVYDVASVFKKIVLCFPAGLLGSLGLYHTIHDIEQNLQHKPDQPETEFAALKARLIALAISSVDSDQRFNLICAVLGLASLIGHESEKAKAQPSDSSSPSGLMTYRALSIVLGPLLLGDATKDLPSLDPQPTALPENSKKTRKQKRNTVPDQKLAQSESLQESVRKANLTARTLEMLLSNWQDVVKQMQDLAVNGTDATKPGKSTQRQTSGASKYTLASSEDGAVRGAQTPVIKGSDAVQRGESAPGQPSGESKYTLSSSEDGVVRTAQNPVIKGSNAMRRGKSAQEQPSGESMYTLSVPKKEPVWKVGISSRFLPKLESAKKTSISSESSSRHSQGLQPSGSSSERLWWHDKYHGDGDSRESAPLLRSADRKSQMPRQLHTTRTPRGKKVQFARHSRRPSRSMSSQQESQAMRLSDKTVLPHPYLSGQPSTHAKTPIYETHEQRQGSSHSDAPISNYEDLLEPEEETEKVIPTTESTHIEVVGKGGPREKIGLSGVETKSSLKEPLSHDAFTSEVGVNVAYHNQHSVASPSANSQAARTARRDRQGSLYTGDELETTVNTEPNQVKVMAQRFSRPEHGHYAPNAAANPTVYADIYEMPSGTRSSAPHLLEKDSLPSPQRPRIDTSRAKESLIPKPVYEAGRGRRKGESRSPSPSKETTPTRQFRQRPSVHNVTSRDHLTIAVTSNPNDLNRAPEAAFLPVSVAATGSSATHKPPGDSEKRKGVTNADLQSSSPLALDPSTMSHSQRRLPSASVSLPRFESDMSERGHSGSMSQDSDTTVSRYVYPEPNRNTMRVSTLFEENSRLRQEVAKKEEEVNQVRRSLEIAKQTAMHWKKEAERKANEGSQGS